MTLDADAPAILIADAAIVAPLDSPQLAERIAAQADVVTFEFEAVPDGLLADLELIDVARGERRKPGRLVLMGP